MNTITRVVGNRKPELTKTWEIAHLQLQLTGRRLVPGGRTDSQPV
jgi:hypothetical protein